MLDNGDLKGLTPREVDAARRDFGWNELPAVKTTGPLRVLVRQFSSFLVVILLVAACVALAVGERVDAIAIGLVVLLNGVLGFVQEWKAETALIALKNMMAPQAMVRRDGRDQMIPAREIVPGDVMLLSPGVIIAADAQVVSASELSADESILTGESVPVHKDATQGDTLVFQGTAITEGHADVRVTAIGENTEFGKIARLTEATEPKKANLQIKLGHLAWQLGLAALLVAAFVAALGVILGRDVAEMLMTGLSLAVAMVPEGLPAVVTITLAVGATAMVRQNALARRLQAVETLGAASVICTDKTGTLTENKMTATRIWTIERTYEVTGTGYDPAGHIAHKGQRIRANDDQVLDAALQIGLVCTHARLTREGDHWQMTGAPTEGALVTLAFKGWCDLPDENRLRAEIPFSSARKRMSVLYDTGAERVAMTKGAPEQVLEVCSHVMTQDGIRPLTDADRKTIETAYAEMAGQGLRVMGLARRTDAAVELAEEDLTFVGLVGLIDPPRAEVRDAVAQAGSAGIRVIMITGDSPITAQAIAAQLSLEIGRTFTGAELDGLSEAELATALRDHVLFARTKPEQKKRIISALQAQGQIVAMTGDGVNDAPALMQADIGVSMGIRGTDVARDASDLVLLDDNFATIVKAIGEGRRQFANVRKFVRYLLSSNAGEVIAIFLNLILGGPLIFLATQILWMNLVTDGVTAVALGLEKSEPDQMDHPPRAKSEPILGWGGILTILLLGTYTGLSSLWIFFHLLEFGVELARTTAFTAMVVFEKMSVFAFRSLRLTVWRIGWFSNPLLLAALVVTLGAQVLAVYWPPLQLVLHTVPIGPFEWLLIGAFALPIIVVPEVLKALASPRQRAT